jgi:hypothetical protein
MSLQPHLPQAVLAVILVSERAQPPQIHSPCCCHIKDGVCEVVEGAWGSNNAASAVLPAVGV